MTGQANDRIRILVVEDEPDLCEAMVSFLNLEEFLADGVGSTSAADAWLKTHAVDIVVLDVGLPDRDGISWLREIAAARPLGVIMATAHGELSDRLRGLTAGADAYLVKPIELDELLAIVRNVARRLHQPPAVPASRWQFDSVRWTLTSPQQHVLRLTRSEAILMGVLAKQPGKAVGHDELVLALGHRPDCYDRRRMEILVRRLRDKVASETSLELPLETAYRVGYAFVADIADVQQPETAE